jgi:tripartite-type tricarboxylate transporter receptor subunit TctC
MCSIKQSVRVLALGIGVLVLPAIPCSAQSWPERTVRVIVPNPAGVAIDIIARLFAERLAARWGQPVIVENLPGADGIIAVREFAGRRDRHSLLYSFAGPITINPLMYEKLPYNLGDLVPIASTSDNFLAVAASASLKVGSLSELAAFSRTRKLNWTATPGLPYFALAGFAKSADMDAVHVSYRDFNQAFVDLAQGRIDIVAAGMAPLVPQARAGKIRLLAYINPKRSPAASEVPTIAEAGYSNLTFSAVTGYFGWRDIAAELRERISADVREIAADPSIQARLAGMGSAARGSSPAEFAAAIEEQRTKVEAIAKLIGYKPKQ